MATTKRNAAKADPTAEAAPINAPVDAAPEDQAVIVLPPAPIDVDKEMFTKMRKELKSAKRLLEKGPEMIAKLEERLAKVGEGAGAKDVDYESKINEIKEEWTAKVAEAQVIQEQMDKLKRSLGYKPRKANPNAKPRIVADPVKLRRVALRKALVKRGFEFIEDVGTLGNLEVTLGANDWTLRNVAKDVTLADTEEYGKGCAEKVDLLRAA